MQKNNWQERAVLLSFWVFSAWYLYIGGLLTEHLTFTGALASIVLANLVFVVIFTLYAGTGKGKDALFQETFGSGGAKYFISLLPVISQVGWYAVVVEIGGAALATALGLKDKPLGRGLVIGCYALFTIWIAIGGLKRMAKLSYWSIPAMIGFSLWGAYKVFSQLGWEGLSAYQPPNSAHGMTIGIQILIASFISAAVTIPDFLHDLGSRKKIFLASFWGLIPATLWVGGLGAAFAIVGKSFNVLQTLQIMGGPFFAYLLLSVDNLCGAQAVFPVGTGLASVFSGDNEAERETAREKWTVAGGLIALVLAEIGIVGRLEIWLTLLGTIFAPIIGVVLANQYVWQNNYSTRKVNGPAMLAWLAGSVVALCPVGVPVLVSLVLSFAFYLMLEGIADIWRVHPNHHL